ncbi:MAG TPA: hypothetical protein VEG67_02625, partial [Myxococcota bacterium]|nr:hypothetical protein [Myxococcota bacterium]
MSVAPAPLSLRRLGLVLLLLLVLLFVSGALVLMAGPAWLAPREVLRILLGGSSISASELPARDIVLRIRLPR